ncbi:MAG: YbgC/FadM family acyl-CoA thioesterase [Nitrospirae bacterium]|nr:YbgC/FadM family acyl-CoA thioesterase [Nitrospirota bacterium]MDA1305509.1 YbgC/FadM family acyl-CoA thioesterase [Nitrospirota bacterium]
MDIKIYYEDTDCGGVVYYANFLKYFERARTEYLADHGLSVAELQQQGTLFLVTHAEVFYRSSAHYGETLEIETTVVPKRKTAIIFAHTIREQKSQRMIVEGSATLVTVDKTGKVRRIPNSVLEAVPIVNPIATEAEANPASPRP